MNISAQSVKVAGTGQEVGSRMAGRRSEDRNGDAAVARKVLYVDMDNVLVDFMSGVQDVPADIREQYDDSLSDIPGIFARMEPIPGAIEAFRKLARVFDVYILSTAPWDNPEAWMHKREWVERHLGRAAYKRLILSHNKHLNRGDFLVDDRTKNGAGRFEGELVLFGQPPFEDWNAVTPYLLERA